MSSAVKFHQFIADLKDGVHANIDTDTLKLALSNTAPDAATDAVFADITEIAAGNGYTAGGYDIAAVYDLTSGVITITGTDQVVEASGGSIGPFRYVVMYNDTPAAPADPLICYWDRGTSITLADGESVLLDLSNSDKALTIS